MISSSICRKCFVTTSIPSLGQTKNYDIVGFSFGGIYAGQMATIHKDRVGTVVLIGTGGMGVDEAPHTRREMQRLSRDMDYETWLPFTTIISAV